MVGIAASKRRKIRALAKSTLWDVRGLGTVLDGMGQIPIVRGAGDTKALANAIEALREAPASASSPRAPAPRPGDAGAQRRRPPRARGARGARQPASRSRAPPTSPASPAAPASRSASSIRPAASPAPTRTPASSPPACSRRSAPRPADARLPQAARARPARPARRGLAGAFEGVPGGAEGGGAVAVGFARALVAGRRCRAAAGVGDLGVPSLRCDRAELAAEARRCRLRRAFGQQRRPGLGAGAVAGRVAAPVAVEGVEGKPFGVDQDQAEPGRCRARRRRSLSSASPLAGVWARPCPSSWSRRRRRAGVALAAAAAAAAGEQPQRRRDRRQPEDVVARLHVLRLASGSGRPSCARAAGVARRPGRRRSRLPAWTPIAGVRERSSAELSTASESSPQR